VRDDDVANDDDDDNELSKSQSIDLFIFENATAVTKIAKKRAGVDRFSRDVRLLFPNNPHRRLKSSPGVRHPANVRVRDERVRRFRLPRPRFDADVLHERVVETRQLSRRELVRHLAVRGKLGRRGFHGSQLRKCKLRTVQLVAHELYRGEFDERDRLGRE